MTGTLQSSLPPESKDLGSGVYYRAPLGLKTQDSPWGMVFEAQALNHGPALHNGQD